MRLSVVLFWNNLDGAKALIKRMKNVQTDDNRESKKEKQEQVYANNFS